MECLEPVENRDGSESWNDSSKCDQFQCRSKIILRLRYAVWQQRHQSFSTPLMLGHHSFLLWVPNACAVRASAINTRRINMSSPPPTTHRFGNYSVICIIANFIHRHIVSLFFYHSVAVASGKLFITLTPCGCASNILRKPIAKSAEHRVIHGHIFVFAAREGERFCKSSSVFPTVVYSVSRHRQQRVANSFVSHRVHTISVSLFTAL